MKYIEPSKKFALKQMNLISGGKKVNCGGLTYCHIFNEMCDPFGGICGEYVVDQAHVLHFLVNFEIRI